MKTVTVSYNVYQYAELSEEAKETAKQWYLDGQDAGFFQEDVQCDLRNFFPDSDLKVAFQLAYCQGDGFSIYGKIRLVEFLELVKENFSEKELKFLKWALSEYSSVVEIESPWRSPYINYEKVGFVDEIWSDMEYEHLKNIPWNVLEKFDQACAAYMEDLCEQYEKWGYSYFYEVDDETMEDMCEANGYWFTEDGRIA